MVALAKNAQIIGPERVKLAGQLSKQYKKGASIRQLAKEHGRSYGAVHQLLLEASVPLRSRGGREPRKAT